jgi:hypothetical protein
MALRVKKIKIILSKWVQLIGNEHKVSTNFSVHAVSYTSLGRRSMGKGMQITLSSNQLTMDILSLLRGTACSTAQRNSSMVQANHSSEINMSIMGTQDLHTSRNHLKIIGARSPK